MSIEAVNPIKPFAIRHQELNSSDVYAILSKSQQLFVNVKRRFNFDDPRGFSDDEYHLLTSLSKDDFNELIEIVSSASIRNSSNRSIRTAIGIYLRMQTLPRTIKPSLSIHVSIARQENSFQNY